MIIYPYFSQQKKNVKIIAHQMKIHKQIYNKLHEKENKVKTKNNGIFSQRFRRGQCVLSCRPKRNIIYSALS